MKISRLSGLAFSTATRLEPAQGRSGKTRKAILLGFGDFVQLVT
jgi:hypothetical protein